MPTDLGTVIAAGGVAVTLLTAMVIGGTELVKALFDKNYRTAAIIAVSVVIGALGGALLFKEIGLALGIVVGLSGSGVITALKQVGSGVYSGPSDVKK